MSKERSKSIKTIFLATLIALAFFVAYSFLSLTAPPRDNSPDENSNRFFSMVFAETGRLWWMEPLNFLAPDMIHPRSVKVQDEFLLPGGFIGLPAIYGGIAGGIGLWSLPFLTALFALLALFGFGLTVGKFFGKRLGWFSAVLLAGQANWWYQSSRPFMPNILFLSLVMLSAGFFWEQPIMNSIRRRDKREFIVSIDSLLSGVFLGLALAVRPPEAYWIVLTIMILTVIFGVKKYWKRILSFFFGSVIAGLPFLFLNKVVYGDWLSSGYASSPTNIPVGSLPGGFGAKLIGPLQPYLFPLGFAPRTAFGHFWDFGLSLFSWWWLLVLTSVILIVVLNRQKINRRNFLSATTKAWIISAIVISLWLVLFYGSWTIRDNPDPEAISLGSSYLRYWLPIFVFSVLPVAWVMDRIWEKFRHGEVMVVILLVATVLASGVTVFASSSEGLLAMRENLRKSDRVAEKVFEITEPRSLVIVDRGDKFIFPGRPVLYPLRSDTTWEALNHLGPRLKKVYYLGITLPNKDIDWLNSEKLVPMNLQIRLMYGFGEESLYVFEYQDTE